MVEIKAFDGDTGINDQILYNIVQNSGRWWINRLHVDNGYFFLLVYIT